MAESTAVIDANEPLLLLPDRTCLQAAQACAAFSFRGDPVARVAFGNAIGLVLPESPRSSTENGDRSALWLGPDEWLVLAPAASNAGLVSDAAGLRNIPHALVDVSDCDVGLDIEGPSSHLLLNAGTPLDMDESAFPVGMCVRTLFAKSGVLLWRRGADHFRLHVARSFASYVAAVLHEASRGMRF